MLDVCLLGTGGMMPLPYRWLTSLMMRYNGSTMMIDCGEGTQIAVREKGWSVNPVDVICFTHYHGDHIGGLPGLLLTMGNAERREPLTLIGPAGLEKVVGALRVIAPELPFPIIYQEIRERYPLYLTRDMNAARRWLHTIARGTERTGILVTKESARYKPLAVHILPSDDTNTVHWFLEDKTDTRSSNYLEDAATEIQVQGLELDYACLLWDADVRYEDGAWHYYRFNGQTKWVELTASSESRQELMRYMLNAYRVLLTRARKGMVICIPAGNANRTASGFWEDSTRLPRYYDGTYRYLKSLGIRELPEEINL